MPAGPLAQLTPSSLPLDGSAKAPYCLALLGTHMAPCLVMFTLLPCLSFRSPSLDSSTEQSPIRRELELCRDLEGRQYTRLTGVSPRARGIAMKKLKLTEVKSHSWEYMSWNSNLDLLITEPVLISLHPKLSHCISSERNALSALSHVRLFAMLWAVAH